MPVWRKQYSLKEIQSTDAGTMIAHVGIVFTGITENTLSATMPVDQRTKQPYGLLHGGASVVLAETLASTAGNLAVKSDDQYCVGLEINANHVSSAREGLVLGTTTPLHLGGTTQVWETKITQGDKLICISRMTLAVLKRK